MSGVVVGAVVVEVDVTQAEPFQTVPAGQLPELSVHPFAPFDT
jgi:hypothetical protein